MTIRTDILEAAIEVFSKKGYQRATLDEVAALVGIQKGSLYYHIDTKEDLLLAIHDQLYRELISRTENAISKAKGDPRLALRLIIFANVDLICSRINEVTVCLRDHHSLSPKNIEIILKNRNIYFSYIESEVQKLYGIKKKKSSNKIRIKAFAILGMINWLIEWYDHEIYTPQMVSEIFSDIIDVGLDESLLESKEYLLANEIGRKSTAYSHS